MLYLGETISLVVAFSWTITALCSEVASKRLGALQLNVIRMLLSLCLLSGTLWIFTGSPFPLFANTQAWIWLLMSGLVGYVFGDYCLFNSYVLIGSRFGQLFMTLSAPTAAITGRLLLGEQMRPIAIVGMIVTLSGIALSILSRSDKSEHHAIHFKLPARGIFFAAMAGICQGFGLVLSKVGMTHYDTALVAAGFSGDDVFVNAVLPLPVSASMSFAATTIRAYIGLVGFFLALVLFNKDGLEQLHHAVSDRKAMWCVLASTIFGPFIGVSASLLATQYTSAGIAQTLFALTPILIIAPAAILFHQKVTLREVLGAIISVVGVCLFFV